jgi:hypothetical protein
MRQRDLYCVFKVASNCLFNNAIKTKQQYELCSIRHMIRQIYDTALGFSAFVWFVSPGPGEFTSANRNTLK